MTPLQKESNKVSSTAHTETQGYHLCHWAATAAVQGFNFYTIDFAK